jgi:hypothetical protein
MIYWLGRFYLTFITPSTLTTSTTQPLQFKPTQSTLIYIQNKLQLVNRCISLILLMFATFGVTNFLQNPTLGLHFDHR